MVEQGGRPLVVIDDARAAGIPLPDATRQSVQQMIQGQLDHSWPTSQAVRGAPARDLQLDSANGCQMGVNQPKWPSLSRTAVRNLNLFLR
jgi:hypothetical protein